MKGNHLCSLSHARYWILYIAWHLATPTVIFFFPIGISFLGNRRLCFGVLWTVMRREINVAVLWHFSSTSYKYELITVFPYRAFIVYILSFSYLWARGGEGYSTDAWVVRCGPGVQTLTLFKIEFSDFPIPFKTELKKFHTLSKTSNEIRILWFLTVF